jgi:hypothetical protein
MVDTQAEQEIDRPLPRVMVMCLELAPPEDVQRRGN